MSECVCVCVSWPRPLVWSIWITSGRVRTAWSSHAVSRGSDTDEHTEATHACDHTLAQGPCKTLALCVFFCDVFPHLPFQRKSGRLQRDSSPLCSPRSSFFLSSSCCSWSMACDRSSSLGVCVCVCTLICGMRKCVCVCVCVSV